MGDLFFDSPGNPRPGNMTGGFLRTHDGHGLRYARFDAPASPRGTVVMLQGRNECIEKYFETAIDLAARGLSSVTMDWRGQGGSDRLIRDRMRGHVRRFDDYVGDLDQLFTEVVTRQCPGPYYILGHSTGSLVGLLAAPALEGKVRRMVLVAPFLGVVGLPLSTRGVKRVMTILYWLGIRKLYAYGGKRGMVAIPFVSNKVTSDEARYRRNIAIYDAHPHLALGGPTVSWVRAACLATAKVDNPAFMATIRIPTLIVAAGSDRVVSTPDAEDYARRLKAASLITIDGARHEILQEADRYRQQLLAAFDAFVSGKSTQAA